MSALVLVDYSDLEDDSIIKYSRLTKILIIFVDSQNQDTREEDLFIKKIYDDVFKATEFGIMLRKNKISNLYFSGKNKDCINITAQRAVELGYKATILSNKEEKIDFISLITTFGENGSSKILFDVIPESVCDLNFDAIKNEIQWNQMYQRTNAVPRLISIQATIDEFGVMPIYRHPFDEQPEVVSFTPSVEKIRSYLSNALGQNFNHVLVQYYRDGTDNIGEHTDKTLDILRGSYIVNFSIGATRYMTLQKKNDSLCKVKIPMIHNSLFILDQETNKKWLHSIKADKRPINIKSADESICECKRISFTFRTIATFIDKEGKLYGQGARKDGGCTNDSLDLVQAFSKENHESDFDWDANYAKGFSSVNFNILNSTFDGVVRSMEKIEK